MPARRPERPNKGWIDFLPLCRAATRGHNQTPAPGDRSVWFPSRKHRHQETEVFARTFARTNTATRRQKCSCGGRLLAYEGGTQVSLTTSAERNSAVFKGTRHC